MKNTQSLLIALGVLLVVGLGGYLWTVSLPEKTNSSNTPTANTNQNSSAEWSLPLLGSYGEAITTGVTDQRAIAAGYWSLPSGRVGLQVFLSNGKSVDLQSDALKNSSETDIQNSATLVNGRTGSLIVTVDQASNTEYHRTYVLEGGFLYEVSIQGPFENLNQQLVSDYQAGLAQLTFAEYAI